MRPVAPRVRLYWVDLDGIPEAAFALVPPAVRKRCSRAPDPRIARRRQAAQVVLRQVLAAETGRSPQALEFSPGRWGKPYLSTDGPWFNLSDSAGLALVAVSTDGEVGADVQRIRPVRHWRRLAGRIFGPAGVRALEEVPPHARDEAVIAAWCRYEAWAKARGTGLARAGALPPGVAGAIPPDGRSLGPSSESPRGWWLVDLPAPAGFRAACVVAGAAPPVLLPGTDGP